MWWRNGAQRSEIITLSALQISAFSSSALFAAEISSLKQTWEFCLIGSDSASSEESSRHTSKNANDCKSAPDRSCGCALPYRYARAFSVWSACGRYAIRCTRGQRMDFVHFLSMCKFKAVIRLYCIGRIMEIEERSLYKIYCWITALFKIRINEPLSCRFFQHCVLIKLLPVFTGVADLRHIFYIQLPFDSQLCRRVIFTVMLGFFLCWFGFLR